MGRFGGIHCQKIDILEGDNNVPNKIVLVQPKTGEWDLAGARPPDSLLAISGLPKKNGYDIKIIDQRIDKLWKDTLKKELKDAFLFGTTSMTGPQIKYALEASRFAKENSNIPVVWGGIHASLLPEQTISNEYIDIVVKGEGDFAFLDLIHGLEKKDLQNVRGIYYKDKSGIKKTAERELIKNLDELEDYPYELIDMEKYYGFNIKEGRSITLMTSRGCPYKCAFCYNTVYYKNTWRGMSAKKTVGMIKRVVGDFGVKNIYFEDDNFSANVKRFEQIVDLILEENVNITWGLLGTRVNTLKAMSDELLSKAVRAGCINIDVGIESGSSRMLELVSKDVKLPEVVEVNKRLSKYFDKTKYTFIMGMPTETEEELLESVKLSLLLGAENPNSWSVFVTYCAYPGTRLYDLAIKHGFRPPQDLEEWANINYDKVFWYYPWLDKRRINMMQNFGFTSFFANKNNQYKINSEFFKIIAMLYQPIAKMRFEHNIYQFPVDRLMARMLSRYLD